MPTFEERGDAFQKKFAFDAELEFKASARRNKLLGLWAAEKFGLSGSAAEEYAKEVVQSDLEEPGSEDVFRKLRGDFDKHGVEQSDHQIRRTMEELMTEAVHQIKSEN